MSKKTFLPDPDILRFWWVRTQNDYMAERTLEGDDELVEWCYQHNCTIHDDPLAFIKCYDKKTFALFKMFWV